MEKKVTFSKKIIDDMFDVVIVGGGLAGTFAAISAARENKKVLLCEKYGFLGGMATAGLVSPFMGWFERTSKKIANAGLFNELYEEMTKTGAITLPVRGKYRHEVLKITLDKMIKKYVNLKVLFHALLSDVETKDNKIIGITLSTISGNIKIKGKTFIDATGNGDLFAFAGVEYFFRNGPEEYNQPLTTCFDLSNVDWSKMDKQAVNELYIKFQSEGKISNPRENVLYFPTPVHNLMHFNTTRVIKKNACDVEDLSEAEFIGRKQVFEMYNFLKENFEAFKDSELAVMGDEIGIRESRRVCGLYKLTEDDVLNTKKFEDSIARGTYSVDIHNPNGSGTVLKAIPECDYYTIPYRSLVPTKLENLIVSGRAICCTHEAHSAIRIMPITSCIGEACGIAASLAIDNDCSFEKVPVKEVQGLLTKYNALY